MRNTNAKCQTKTKSISKCKKRFIAYNDVQWKYADKLNDDPEVKVIQCNVPIPGCLLGNTYTTDFVCIKNNGETFVAETTTKKLLLKPLTCKRLEASHLYWLARGITDFRLIIGVPETDEEVSK